MNSTENEDTDLLELIKDQMNDLSIYDTPTHPKEISAQTTDFLTGNNGFTDRVIASIQNDFNYWSLESGIYDQVPNYRTEGLVIIQSITNFIIGQFTRFVNNKANIYLCQQNLPQDEVIICQSQGQGGKGAHFELKYNDNIIKIDNDGSCLFRALLLFDYITKKNIPPSNNGFLNQSLLIDVSV